MFAGKRAIVLIRTKLLINRTGIIPESVETIEVN